MIYRSRMYLGELEVITPSTVTELRYVTEHARPEEREEEADAGGTWQKRVNAMLAMRRTASVYHRGYLLALAGVTDLPQAWPDATDGKGCARLLTMERTVHALEKGHRFAWLKGYAELAKWYIETDRGAADRGPVLAVSPTNIPRALDVYRYVGARVVKTVNLNGRDYWVLRIGENMP